MLSPDTMSKVKDFLMAVAHGELAVEKKRQELALPEFEAYSTFVRIDRNGDNIIDSGDVAHFLSENQRHQFTQRDYGLMVKYFDIDMDGGLNYTEFLQMILPCDDLVLRADASQRQAGANINKYADGERVYTTYTVERAISDFLESEIHLHLQLESLKSQLHSKYDWSMHAAFQAIDVTKEGFLNYRNIQQFLAMQGQMASDEMVIAMVRRLDADADQIVQFTEFCEIFNPVNPQQFHETNPFALKNVIRRNKFKSNISEGSVGRANSRSPYRSASQSKRKKVRSGKRRLGDSPLRNKSAGGIGRRTHFTEKPSKRSVRFQEYQKPIPETMPRMLVAGPPPVGPPLMAPPVAPYDLPQRSGSPLRHYESASASRPALHDYFSPDVRRTGSPLRPSRSPERGSPVKEITSPFHNM